MTTANKETTNNPTPKPTREQIVALAKEFNTYLDLKPAISVTARDAIEVIQAQIENHSVKLTAADFVPEKPEDEHLSEAAITTYTALGYKVPKKATRKPATETTPTTTGRKTRGQGTSTKEPAKPKEKAFTWTDATAQAIRKVCKNGATLPEIKAEAVKIYKDKGLGGETEPKNVFRYMVATLVEFKHLELKDGKYKFVA